MISSYYVHFPISSVKKENCNYFNDPKSPIALWTECLLTTISHSVKKTTRFVQNILKIGYFHLKWAELAKAPIRNIPIDYCKAGLAVRCEEEYEASKVKGGSKLRWSKPTESSAFYKIFWNLI